MGSVRRDLYQAMVDSLGEIRVALGFETDVQVAAGGGGAQKVGYLQDDTARPYLTITFDRETKTVQTQLWYQCEVHYSIFAYIDEVNEGDTESVEDEIDKLVTDVENRLLHENSLSPPLGIPGCEDITLEGHQKYIVANEAVQGAEITGTIKYTHTVSDVNAP